MYAIGIISSLNIWQNLLLKPSRPGDFYLFVCFVLCKIFKIQIQFNKYRAIQVSIFSQVNYGIVCLYRNFWASLIAQLVNNPPARRPWFNSWVREIPWRRARLPTPVFLDFPCGSAGKESTCNVGDLGSITGLGRFPWRRESLPTPVFWPGELYSP